MKTFKQIIELGEIIPEWKLPTTKGIKKVENQIGFTYPESYKNFIKKFGNISFGYFDLLRMTNDEQFEWLYAPDIIKEAWELEGVPNSLIPIVHDNGNYYCFNTNSENSKEPEIKYWANTGSTSEHWKNFDDWVEKCWIGEFIKNKGL